MNNHLLEAGDRVVAGVSGGADSVCLLFLLCAFRENVPFSLRVVHVHHGIREEADEDAAYVEELCKGLKVPFFQVKVDVPKLARLEGLTEEEAGRKARYEAFRDFAMKYREEEGGAPIGDRRQKPVKIALAHHMGDRAETLLFHLFRGSGLKGLGSIQPVRETKEGDEIIRPLLCLTREEIEAYLAQKGVKYCQDRTNFEDEHARNRIRHHILPYAEEEICHGAVRHLNEAAQLLSETESYLQQQTEKAREECVKAFAEGAEGYQISAEVFTAQPVLLQKRLVLELLNELSISHKDIGSVHVEAVLELFEGETGREKHLPFGIVARREYSRVILEKRKPQNAERPDEKGGQVLEIPKESVLEGEKLTLAWGKQVFEFQRFPCEKVERIPENTYTKWFDYDKIKNTLSVRTRKSGDVILLRGGEGCMIRKTVKDYFVTEKIPRTAREELPLLTEGGQVLWIVGHRISEYYKVDAGTKTILQVEIKEKQ